jgi:hypothetical protein
VAAVTLDLRIRGRDKMKLMMMNGGGGIMGALGGGESQRAGVTGVAEFVRRYFPPRWTCQVRHDSYSEIRKTDDARSRLTA